jgi:hypothetical protein
MRKSKSNRIFLAVITGALCVAGTGLTIANNWENDPQIAAVAIALAASFFAAEGTFFWAHKTWEHLNRLWRKVTLAVAMGALVLAMAGAVASELEVALNKLAGRSVAQNIGGILEKVNAGATQRERGRNNRAAFAEISKGKIDYRVWPFVICYAVAGLVTIVILGVQVGERGRASQPRATKGDQIPANPVILEKAHQMGFVRPGQTVKAYADVDRQGEVKGVSIHADGQYSGYIPKSKL